MHSSLSLCKNHRRKVKICSFRPVNICDAEILHKLVVDLASQNNYPFLVQQIT
jgi:hypothetical protein